MQRKEQKVILLEDLPDQDEYEKAQPKVGTSSRRSSSRLAKGPLGGTGPQRGHDSYQKADGPTDGEQTIDRPSSVEVEFTRIPSGRTMCGTM